MSLHGEISMTTTFSSRYSSRSGRFLNDGANSAGHACVAHARRDLPPRKPLSSPVEPTASRA
jgi:hypothetical protein